MKEFEIIGNYFKYQGCLKPALFVRVDPGPRPSPAAALWLMLPGGGNAYI